MSNNEDFKNTINSSLSAFDNWANTAPLKDLSIIKYKLN